MGGHGAGEHRHGTGAAGVARHEQIGGRVADDDHLRRLETTRGTEGTGHAGSRLGAVAGIGADHEVDAVRDPEVAQVSMRDRRVVHGRHAECQATAPSRLPAWPMPSVRRVVSIRRK